MKKHCIPLSVTIAFAQETKFIPLDFSGLPAPVQWLIAVWYYGVLTPKGKAPNYLV